MQAKPCSVRLFGNARRPLEHVHVSLGRIGLESILAIRRAAALVPLGWWSGPSTKGLVVKYGFVRPNPDAATVEAKRRGEVVSAQAASPFARGGG
jgi:hypothetical protein